MSKSITAANRVSGQDALRRIDGSSRRLMRLIGLLGGFALSLSSCAAPSRYMGISLQPGGADSALQSLAERARSGDKRAQLELGIVFEEGKGLEPNRANALHLYELAARDTPSTRWIYVPSPGGGAPSRVIPIAKQSSPGLAEAKLRLEHLQRTRSGEQIQGSR